MDPKALDDYADGLLAIRRTIESKKDGAADDDEEGEKKGGTLKIAYSTLDQLDEICRRLLHHPQDSGADQE